MSARLRSEKGSFVQSPKRAFETESAPANGGIVTVAGALVTNNSSRIDVPGGCFHLFDLDVGFNSTRTQMDWTFPRLPVQIDLLTGAFRGVTSGTVWRLSDYTITLQCQTGTQRLGYENRAAPPNGPYYAHVVSDDTSQLRTFIVSNIGRHPLAPHPAFQQGEAFEWLPD